jgi:aspartyl-tRNA(Asn)/glutamyl-tRNA(Gln) amidotransferase subunit B
MRADWEVVIGLETHAQLTTASKIFSGARSSARIRAQASAVDIALPGTLPVLNKGAVGRAIRFRLAIPAARSRRAASSRGNYFYRTSRRATRSASTRSRWCPAAPSPSGRGKDKTSLTRAHLRDAASCCTTPCRFLRRGLGARAPARIVTEPDMRSVQAVAYAKKLHEIVTWIGICDGNMQEAHPLRRRVVRQRAKRSWEPAARSEPPTPSLPRR